MLFYRTEEKLKENYPPPLRGPPPYFIKDETGMISYRITTNLSIIHVSPSILQLSTCNL